MFVADAASPAATGPQGIKHAAGFRPALITTDPGSTPLSNADGHALGVTLAEWLAATGEATLTPTSDGAVMIRARFEHLRPDAEYSLFENHFDQSPVGFTPLDGTGTTNAFKTNAQGVGVISLVAPQPLTHANAVLVIWDDDGQTHGLSRGDVGVSAQHQLIARPAG